MMSMTTLDRPDRQAIAFEVAKERYLIAHAEFERLWDAHNAAEEQHDRECPRIDEYFDKYGLGIGMSRERVVEQLRAYFWKATGWNGLVVYPPEKAAAQAASVEESRSKIEALADEFMAYQQRDLDLRVRLRIKELDQAATAYGAEHFFPARQALMELPASDRDGLFLKMEMAATWFDEPWLESLFSDAKRLLGER